MHGLNHTPWEIPRIIVHSGVLGRLWSFEVCWHHWKGSYWGVMGCISYHICLYQCTYVPKPCPNFRIEQEPKLGLQPNFGTRGEIYPSVHLVFFIGSRVQFLSEVGTKTGSNFFLNLVSVPTGWGLKAGSQKA